MSFWKKIKKILYIVLGDDIIFRIYRLIFKRSDASLIKENKFFEGKYTGERCFIFGNGPSINDLDFSLFSDEYVFTVNQLSRNDNFYKLKTNFHMWADERFFNIDSSREEDLELIEVMKKVKTEDNNPIVFYKSLAKSMLKEFDLEKELNIHYFSDVLSLRPQKTYIDFSKPVPCFSTVIHYCICMAVYMGFSEIYLLGCDCTGIANTIAARNDVIQKYQYGYNVSENAKKLQDRIQTTCSFDKELSWYADLIRSYAFLNDYCEKHSCKLYNATHITLLDNVEKVDVHKILKTKKR